MEPDDSLMHEDTDDLTVLEGSLRRSATRSARFRKLLIVCGALVPIAIPLTLAGKVIESASEADVTCSNRDYDEAPGASAGCEGDARFWLWWPKLLPWTRREAVAMDLEIQAAEADRAITRAVQVDLDASARDAAIDRLVATMRRDDFSSERRTRDWAFAITADSGARLATVRHGADARRDFDAGRLITAAISLGDWNRALAFARVVPEQESFEYALRRGALLCLGGELEKGRDALRLAQSRYEESVHYPYAEAQIALRMCGEESIGSNRTYRDVVAAAELLSAPERSQVETLLSLDSFESDSLRENRAPFFAEWMRTPRASEDIVDQASLVNGFPLVATPWALGYPLSTGYILSPLPLATHPDAFEHAADALDALRERIARGEIVLPEVDRFRVLGITTARDLAQARGNAPAVLANAASVLRVRAMLVRFAFDRNGAAALAEALAGTAQPPIARLAATAVLMQTGHHARAREIARELVQTEDRAQQAFAFIDLALIELSLGNPEGAHVEAKNAVSAAHALPSNDPVARMGSDLVRTSSEWLLLATSIRTARFQDAPNLSLSLGERGEVAFRDLVRASPEERRRARFHASNLDVASESRFVLPAVLYVLRRAVEPGRDADVWLDSILGVHHPSLNGPMAMRARAEEARWRRDNAARMWEARATTIESHVRTPRDAVLAHVAEIIN